MSSPFIDAASASGFFDIILKLFIQDKRAAFGKLVGRYRYISEIYYMVDWSQQSWIKPTRCVEFANSVATLRAELVLDG